MISDSEAAEVESAIRGWPSRAVLFSRAKEWTTEHAEYALSKIDQLTDPKAREAAEAMVKQILTMIKEEKTRSASDAQNAQLLKEISELRRAVQKGPSPHWTQSFGFWVSVAAAIAAAIAALPVIQTWVS